MRLIYTSFNLILFIILFSGCNSKSENATPTDQFDTKIQLTLINEWKINSPAVVPDPRSAGVILKDTSLVLADYSLNTINRFDKQGSLLQTLGGTGRGPAEFTNITDAAINSNGKVAVADLNNARFTILNIFGDSLDIESLDPGWHTRLHWVANQLVITNNPFKEGASNPSDIFMRLYDPESGEKEAFFQMELEWGDSVPDDQKSCTFCGLHFMKDLVFFTSPQDTSYRIYKINPQTNETLLFTRSGIPAVTYTDKEIKELKNEKQRMHQITGLNSKDKIPTHKPRFIDFFPDQKGRLWALLTPSEAEAPVFDIFSQDATYIGSLRAPQGTLSARYIPNHYILFIYKTEDPDIWKGGLYKFLDQR
ncbi:hypothetical protein [Fodinibius halophilus]|uniref:6-bladed beta-propeller n=1 Tax=Fodinibius halophilus TaxID=1736908 RepID=A0A6M1TGN7_9BACT|nr:hypothetical protein [Fodinibius halophilus]NGP89934.1 hypothetical protein [Fodinibius halophilus]